MRQGGKGGESSRPVARENEKEEKKKGDRRYKGKRWRPVVN